MNRFTDIFYPVWWGIVVMACVFMMSKCEHPLNETVIRYGQAADQATTEKR